jgi:hypothetical protein
MGAGLCHFYSITLIFRTLKKQASLAVEDRSTIRSALSAFPQPIQPFLSLRRCLHFVKALLDIDSRVGGRSLLGILWVSNELFATILEYLARSFCSEQVSGVAVKLPLMP